MSSLINAPYQWMLIGIENSRKTFLYLQIYNKTSRQAGNDAVTVDDFAVACWYLTVFLRCGAVPVLEFGENIATLLPTLYYYHCITVTTCGLSRHQRLRTSSLYWIPTAQRSLYLWATLRVCHAVNLSSSRVGHAVHACSSSKSMTALQLHQ